jgi:hypothetical protein
MPRRGSSSGRPDHTGRIRPDQRDTDDTTPTVHGTGLRPEHAAAIFTTEDKSMSDGCRRNYRNRIRRMIGRFRSVQDCNLVKEGSIQ